MFDNDGTLWAEQPMYFQFAFALDRVKALAPQHPEWKTTEPFKAVLDGDMKGARRERREGHARDHGRHARRHDHRGVRQDRRATGSPPRRHPRFKRPYTEMVYQPMLELLAYLRANGFKTFIVSGGGIEFMRPWTEKVYGIPPEQVVGSSGETKFEMRDGKPVLIKAAEGRVHRRRARQAGRHRPLHRPPADPRLRQLRRRPADAGVDDRRRRARASWALVHHTDAEREWAYDRKSHDRQARQGLGRGAAAQAGPVVDMKNDWKVIYPFELR